MSDGDDEGKIVLRGVPFFPGGAVPDGWTALIAEIAELNEDAPAQEVAESIAEDAINRVYSRFRDEEEGVREPYKTMLDDLRVEQDRQALVNTRRAFGSIVNEHHNQFIEQQEQDGEEDGPDLDPEKCQYVKDESGEQCQNDRPEGEDYCHIDSHGPSESEGDDSDD